MHRIRRLIITINAVMTIHMKAIIMMPIVMAAKGIRMMSIIIRDVTMIMPRKSILMKATITAMRGIVAPRLQNN